MYESVLQPTSFGTIPKSNSQQRKSLILPFQGPRPHPPPHQMGKPALTDSITRYPEGNESGEDPPHWGESELGPQALRFHSQGPPPSEPQGLGDGLGLRRDGKGPSGVTGVGCLPSLWPPAKKFQHPHPLGLQMRAILKYLLCINNVQALCWAMRRARKGMG